VRDHLGSIRGIFNASASYEKGHIDVDKMRYLEAVNAHCPSCFNSQGGHLSNFSKKMKEIYGF